MDAPVTISFEDAVRSGDDKLVSRALAALFPEGAVLIMAREMVGVRR